MMDASMNTEAAADAGDTDTTAPDRTAELAKLAALSHADYTAARAEAAKLLGLARGALDAAVKKARAEARAKRDAEGRAAPPPPPGKVRWPAWVLVRDEGMYADMGEASPPLWLSGPFDVLGEARSPEGDGWALWLRWKDRDRRLKSWPLPRRLLYLGAGEAEGELAGRGLRLSPDFNARARLRQALAEVEAGDRVTLVNRAGWHGAAGAGGAFLMPDGDTIGTPPEPLVLAEMGEEAATRCAMAGTLEGWQRGVAAIAAGNPLAAFAMSCAFAGPLLLPLGETSGGFHLAGGSKEGKTTCCQMAATAWGPPTKGGPLRDWHATSNGLEAAAEEAGDALLLLDEIHQADPRAVVGAVYALAGEGGKQRLNRDAKARRRRTWRTFILSNGEICPSVAAAKAGTRLPAGAAVRLPSIPVGRGGAAWPNLHGAADFAALMTTLHAGMRAHHGHGARAFVAELAKLKDAELAEVRAVLAGLRDRMALALPDGADAQARDVSRRFALAAAAGELATAWGILPWPQGTATGAADRMMAAWLAGRGNAGAAEDADALDRVRTFIAQHGAARFAAVELDQYGNPVEGDTRPVIRRAGFRKVLKDHGTAFLFFPEVWQGEVFDGADGLAGAKALAAAGHLVPGEKGKLQRHVRVPGHDNPVRFYAVRAAIMEAAEEEKTEAAA